jgi:hypothetical protein
MVTLVVAALLWGNCLTCPQMATHSCCPKPQPASFQCHMENMQHFVKADGPATSAPMAAELAELPAADAPAPQQPAAALPDLHAPPGSPGTSTNLRV